MKFHLIRLGAQESGRLLLQRLEQRMGVDAVDLDLGEHRERDGVLVSAEPLDGGLVARFLMAELVAGEAEHGEAAPAKALVQRLEARVLRREAAFAGDIDDQQRLSQEIAEHARLAVDGFEGNVGGKRQTKLIGRWGFLMSLSRRGRQIQQGGRRAGAVAEFGIEAVISEVQGGLSASGSAR